MSTVITDDGLKVRDQRASALEERAASAQPLAVLPSDLNQETVLLQVISRGAADKTIDLDRMERLLVMQERLAAKRAEQDFIHAMAEFKQNAPRIAKDKHVSFPHRDGDGSTDYWHATLGAVCAAATAGLGAVGISHRWDLKQLEGGRVEVTCILTHVGGHSVRTTLSGPPDASGKKNNIQQVASTITYLERYTLLAATGLATETQDDDGRGGAGEDLISEEQLANLEALITEVGADRKKFLKLGKVERIGDLPANKYTTAVQWLQNLRSGT